MHEDRLAECLTHLALRKTEDSMRAKDSGEVVSIRWWWHAALVEARMQWSEYGNDSPYVRVLCTDSDLGAKPS